MYVFLGKVLECVYVFILFGVEIFFGYREVMLRLVNRSVENEKYII